MQLAVLLAQVEQDGGEKMSMSAVQVGVAIFFMLLNFAISWFNAWSVGRAWADAKAMGGFAPLVVWCGAIMSACGFTWVYLIVVSLLAGYLGVLPPEYVQGAIELGYLVLIIPIIGSGLGITAHSIQAFVRNRSLANGGVAAWNTYAQIHNTVNAIRSVPPILEHLGELFGGGGKSSSGGNGKGKAALLMVVLVILALIGGILTTSWIVRTTAANYSGEVSNRIGRLRRRGELEPV